VIGYWIGRIKQYESREDLLQLTKFFSEAAKLSQEVEDDEYVIADAEKAEQDVNTRIFRLQPFYEGVYQTSLTCEPGRPCPFSWVDRLVILDSISTENVKISFSSSKLGVEIYAFTQVKVTRGGTRLEALAPNAGAGTLAKLELDFDITTRRISGRILTPETTFSVQAQGDPASAPISIFESQRREPNPVAVAPEAFEKTFSGTYGGKPAKLKINAFTEDEVGATLTIDSLGLRLRFQSGRFFPKTGVLVLVGAQSSSTLKLALGVRTQRGTGDLRINGISFSLNNGTTRELQFR
jgi:hypothetical protein